MELSIIRRETTGAPPNQYNESETITKFEVRPQRRLLGLVQTKASPVQLALTPSLARTALLALSFLDLVPFALHLLAQIMDGAPVRGETIPIRLFLGGFELTPTFRDVNKKFSARYYLNLVLIDEENRRYFKQNGPSAASVPSAAGCWTCAHPNGALSALRHDTEITVFRVPEN
jgi:vacuolar protein sorting-associated protein 26